MENISVDIPEIQHEKDFTIVYKGKESKDENKESIIEIQTSRDDLLKKLQHFKSKSNEIKYLSEYYIHDEFDIAIFKSFIDSVRTHKIDLNDNNYIDLYKLSSKYEYLEMKKVIAQFIENRPDLQRIIEKLSSNNSIEDIEKEKIISKNLDFFLEHGNLFKLPIQTLARILNSPFRILKDHHLLFNFIKKMISESKEQNSEETHNHIKENMQIMVCALDCNEMSTNEILELLEITKNFCLFNLRNANEKIKTILEMDKGKDIKISKLEEDIINQKNEIKQLNQRIEIIERKYEEKETAHENDIKELHQKIEKKFEEKETTHENEIKELHQKIEKKFEEHSKLIAQYQNDLSKYASHQNIEELNKGIIQYLTKNCGGNVADKGIVKLTASSLYDTKNTYPLKNVVDIDEKKTSFVSGNKPNSWVKYDFVDKRIHPTHYLLRSAHDNRKGTNNMMSWVCEGSNTDDENDWKILDSRNDVTYLDYEGASYKFEIQTHLQQNECYRYLRIRQTKPNSGNGNYLVISALEYYGSIIS